ncbi:ATP12-domain-containing protein [Xylariaceae sp. AK1471]|nr:ATP12-domain-containing protein [Xylariaceae sp. AK1471]
MKPPTRTALRLVARQSQSSSVYSSFLLTARHIHSTPASPATVSPIHGTGPPPAPPRPAADSAGARLERRKKHAALLEKAQEIRASTSPSSSSSTTKDKKSATSSSSTSPPTRRRFWKHVHVREVEEALEVHLDTRPLRHPSTKEVVRLPKSKPLLAAALALEWDLLVSPQQATKQHLIPLTSLVCRALDIADDDAGKSVKVGGSESESVETIKKEKKEKKESAVNESLRTGIARMLMRYLDTDSLLCWAPPPRHGHDAPNAGGHTLRELQKRASEEIVAYITTHVWPGVEIVPVLNGESIMPRSQKPETRQIIEGWIMGLSPWELAGLEKAVLAGKGLLGAVRLLVEWSEGFVGVRELSGASEKRQFGVKEAARLASIEVDWQIGNWGEVEDTHDVEKEDLRRQFGSVVLLVSGTGRQ